MEEPATEEKKKAHKCMEFKSVHQTPTSYSTFTPERAATKLRSKHLQLHVHTNLK
jgi:hypothetical protein